MSFQKVVLILLLVMNSQVWAQKILVLGDSITEGYGVSQDQAFPALLQKMLRQEGYPKVEVLNGGIGGSTTASGAQRLRWHLKSKPDVLIIALGANDGLRGVRLEDSQKNLLAIVKAGKEAGISKIVLAGMLLPINYGEVYRKQFQKIYEELAQQEKLVLVPFLLEGVGGVVSLNQTDGIHPNERGHQRIAQTIKKYIIPLL